MKWTTSDVPARARFGYWLEAICRSYVDLDSRPADRAAFVGELDLEIFGDVALATIGASGQDVTRDRRHIARCPRDLAIFVVQREGTSVIEQDGRQAHLSPGDLALFDTTRPYALRMQGPFRHLVLHCPRERLTAHLGEPHLLTATTISGQCGLGAVAAGLLEGFDRERRTVDAISAQIVAEHFLDLASAAFTARERKTDADDACASAQFQRLRVLMRARLRDPALTPADIAAAAGLSLRQTQRVFARRGQSIARAILEERLACCRRDLIAQTSRTASITEIALRWGFNDSAHFSRAFKARFGVTPRAARSGTHALH
jgi:AraC-like DNA-binding protein